MFIGKFRSTTHEVPVSTVSRASSARVILLVLCAVLLASCQQQSPVQPASLGESQSLALLQTQAVQNPDEISERNLLTWMVGLEDLFGLKDVLIKQVHDSLIVKFKAPTISDEEVNEGLAQVLAYLDVKAPQSVVNIRLVFVINYVDVAVVDVVRSEITAWRSGKISNSDFINTFKKISLLPEVPAAHAQDLTHLPVITQQLRTAAAPIIDPLEMMIDLKDDNEVRFSVQSLLDASLKGMTQSEKQMCEKQEDAVTKILQPGKEMMELSPAADQKINLIKEVITDQVEKNEDKWQQEVMTAETNLKLKDVNSRGKFDELERKEQSLVRQIRDDKNALEVMQKQCLQYMHNDQPFAGAMWEDDQMYQQMPKRDFMKETNGNLGEALVNATLAIGGQYKLLGELKDEMRKTQDEQRALLDVRPEPNLEDALKKVRIEWYK